MDVTVNPSEKNPNSAARLKMSVRITVVKDRLKLRDIHLDVGQPILSTKVVEAALETRLNGWMLLKTVELDDPKPGWSNAFFVIGKVTRREAHPDVAGKSLEEDIKLLKARSDAMKKTNDGSFVRLIGNVTLTLADQKLERPDGTIRTTDQVLKAQRVEIRKLDAPTTGGVRAQRMDFDAGAGGIQLTGDVEIVHKSVLIKADSVYLFQDRLVLVAVDAVGAIKINGDRIKRESFRRALKEIDVGPKTSVLLNADSETKWSLVVGLMEDLTALGVTRTSLHTNPSSN